MTDAKPDELTSDGESPGGTVSWGWLLSSGAFVYLVWRILGVAGYDTNTALGIVQVGGAGNAALGIALSSASLVVLTLNVLWLLAVYFEWPWVRDLPNDMKISLSAPLLAPTLFLLPLFVPLLNMGFLLVMTYRWKRPKGHHPDKEFGRAGWALVLFVAWVAAPYWLLISTPWLPSERLVPDGDEPFTGYVVGTEGDELVVLQRGEQTQLRRVAATGLERSLCSQPKPTILRSLPQLVSDGAPYPRCPKLH